MLQVINKLFSQSPIVQLHLGVALLGFSGLFAKLINLPATDIIAYRSFLTAIFLFLILKLLKTPIKLKSLRDYKVAFVLGILAAVHWVTYFYSIQYTSVAIGMITLFTYPVMTAICEPLLRKKLPNLVDVLLSILVLFAVSLLFPSFWQQQVALTDEYILGVGLGLISAMCFAFRNIGIQHYFKGYSGAQGMFYQFLVSAIVCLPFVHFGFSEIILNDWYLLVLLTVFFSAAPHVLFAKSISHFSAKTAGLVACLQPLYGILLGMLILSEQPSMLVLVGGSIIILTAVYETTRTRKQSDS